MISDKRVFKVSLNTLTPIWTGGVDSTMDRIHETGILGSLRWWYEVLVRGLGGSACDPTEHTCPDDKHGNYCDVCAVFGTTGLQRAFRLSGAAWQNEHPRRRLTVKVNNNKGWFLGRGFLGQGEMRFVPLRRVEEWKDDDLLQTLRLTLKFIECWGGLGAKTQQGYGVVAFDENGKTLVLDIEQGIQAFYKLRRRSKRHVVSNDKWPSLEGFFFAKVRFSLSDEPQKWIKPLTSKIEPEEELRWYLNQATNTQRSQILPLAPVVRYHLRALVKTNYSSKEELRHILMGELGRKSLIHVSHSYPMDDWWEFRIWGWVPDELPGNVGRNEVLKKLRQWLGINGNNNRQWGQDSNGDLWKNIKINPEICWFEKNQKENAQDYLRALIEGCNKEKKQ